MFSQPNGDFFSSSTIFLKRLLVIFFILTLLVAFLTVWKYLKVRESASIFVMEGISGKTEDRIRGFFTPVAKDAVMLKQWAMGGVLDLSSPDSLNAKLIPMARQHTGIHSILLWVEDDIRYGLIRDGEKWLTMVGPRYQDKTGNIIWKSIGNDGDVLESWEEDTLKPNSDTAGWSHPPELSHAEDVLWVQTLTLPPAKKSGLSAVVQWMVGEVRYTAAISVLTTRMEQVLDDVMAGDSYRVFLFSRNHFFIGFQRGGTADLGSTKDNKNGYAYPVDDPLLAAAFEIWKKQDKTPVPFKFQWEGRTRFGQFLKLNDGGQSAGFGIIADEKDLVPREGDVRFFFIPVIMGVIWIGLFIYARLYKREAARFAKSGMLDTNREEAILDLIRGGETEKVEFKSTLRWNLKADKAGKEIEMASLKTVTAFMNSDGGILFVGVDDNGTILGISNDRFPNEDKFLRHFSAIFNQHIGLEFSEYIDFGIKKVKDQKILVVNCKKSPQPVFLKHKNDESFFIRSGPSSRKLSISQVLDYLKERAVEK